MCLIKLILLKRTEDLRLVDKSGGITLPTFLPRSKYNNIGYGGVVVKKADLYSVFSIPEGSRIEVMDVNKRKICRNYESF